MAHIIDGKALALKLREEIAREAADLKDQGIVPGLAVVLVGTNPASQIYVKNKRSACEKVGIASFDYDLPENVAETDLINLITGLNSDPKIHGILVQLPLPSHINDRHALESIDPAKDIDGFHPINIGRLTIGEPCIRACTPAGCMYLIDSTGIDLIGKNAVVVGRSNVVGKPTALMLLERNATVTICHSHTRDLAAEVARADVLIAAAGRAQLIQGEWIKPGAIVVDVGINRLADGRLVGDVEFEAAKKHASFITPVPGGVGPMTIAMLLKNTLTAAKNQKSSKK